MNRKVSLGASIAMLIVVSALTLTITMFVSQSMFNSSIEDLQARQSMYSKLDEIDKIARTNYIGDIDEERLKDSIITGYVYGLNDKYATYYSAEVSDEQKLSLAGKSIGIGVSVTEHPDNKTIYVFAVHKDSPADIAGLNQGDEIIKIGDTIVKEVGYSTAFDMLLGEEGKQISITVLRENDELVKEITYKEYKIQSVFYHTIDDIGYIRISEFNSETVDQFKDAIKSLQKQEITGLIFDVRRNGGGTVDSAASILDYLLPKGDIMSVKYSNGNKVVLHESGSSEIDLPMTVLTDEFTASASELFAASIKDYNKGILVGSKTYGKGVMQRTYSLSDGSSMRITIAEYYPPSGTNFNGVGLHPEVSIELNEYQKNHFYLLEDENDPVMQAALDWLESR